MTTKVNNMDIGTFSISRSFDYLIHELDKPRGGSANQSSTNMTL